MRLPPPDRSTLDPETDELLSLATTPSGDTAQTIAVMAHSPALVEPFLQWAMALHTSTALNARLHEIVALRVAHNCGSSYEWDEHVGWARRAGVSDAEIHALSQDPEGWATLDAAVVTAVDELHVDQNLSDATLALLRDGLGDAAAVEIVLVVGQYTMLSMLASATGAAVPHPGGER